MSRQVPFGVRPTRRLVAFATAAWLLLASGLALQRPALVLAAVFVAALLLFGIPAPRRLRIQGAAEVATSLTHEDQPVEIRFDVNARTRRAKLIEYRLTLPPLGRVDSGRDVGIALCSSKRSVHERIRAAISLFGLHSIGPLDIRLRDPLALVVVEGRVAEPQDLRVYPRVEGLKETVLVAKQKRPLMGAYEINRPGHGFDFFGLRDYIVGDRPRDINWKASARQGKFIVNQHQRESDAEIVVLVDAQQGTGVGRATMSPFAQGCRAALAVVQAHLSARDAVRFITYGSGTGEDTHTGPDRHLRGILDAVTSLRPAGRRPLEDVVHHIIPSIRPRSPVFIASPLVGDRSVESAVSLLLSHEHPVYVFVSRPDWGPHENEKRVQDWNAEQNRRVHALGGLGVAVIQGAHETPLEASLRAVEAPG